MGTTEKGQALLLVIVSLGIFLIGAIGLAIDGSQIYAHREMAQAAADAAAQAGVFSIFAGTSAGAYTGHTVGTTYTCQVTPSLDGSTPCVYAQKNGFGLSADDTVSVSFPASVSGVNNASTNFTNPFVQVTITRTVHTTLMQFLGSSSSAVTATGVAGIVQSLSPTPIILLHPSNSGVLSTGGAKSGITILGGPPRAIMVNSSSNNAVGGNGFIDLSKAGPSGAGADFAIFGPTPKPSQLTLGAGKYIQPAAPMNDPFADPVVPEPTQPAAAPASTPLANNVGGCPASPKKSCNMYYPGYYSTSVSIRNETAVLQPGLYYVNGDFGNTANGDIYPCQSVGGVTCTSTGLTGNTGTGSGVTIYLAGSGSFNMTANSDLTLTGSDPTSTYKGILFFSNRTNAASNSHSLGGGGALTITGTIYLVNRKALTTASHYQSLTLGGGSGSGTNITGEIITDEISMGGNSSITMNLNPASVVKLDQVALVR